MDGLGTAAGIVGNWHFLGTNVKKDYELAAKYLPLIIMFYKKVEGFCFGYRLIRCKQQKQMYKRRL